jgi:hypothetical protein
MLADRHCVQQQPAASVNCLLPAACRGSCLALHQLSIKLLQCFQGRVRVGRTVRNMLPMNADVLHSWLGKVAEVRMYRSHMCVSLSIYMSQVVLTQRSSPKAASFLSGDTVNDLCLVARKPGAQNASNSATVSTKLNALVTLHEIRLSRHVFRSGLPTKAACRKKRENGDRSALSTKIIKRYWDSRPDAALGDQGSAAAPTAQALPSWPSSSRGCAATGRAGGYDAFYSFMLSILIRQHCQRSHAVLTCHMLHLDNRRSMLLPTSRPAAAAAAAAAAVRLNTAYQRWVLEKYVAMHLTVTLAAQVVCSDARHTWLHVFTSCSPAVTCPLWLLTAALHGLSLLPVA